MKDKAELTQGDISAAIDNLNKLNSINEKVKAHTGYLVAGTKHSRHKCFNRSGESRHSRVRDSPL